MNNRVQYTICAGVCCTFFLLVFSSFAPLGVLYSGDYYPGYPQKNHSCANAVHFFAPLSDIPAICVVVVNLARRRRVIPRCCTCGPICDTIRMCCRSSVRPAKPQSGEQYCRHRDNYEFDCFLLVEHKVLHIPAYADA